MSNIVTVENLREGNHKAFEMLFNEWYKPLCRYANSILQCEDDAEDVVQKFFYKLWDKHQQISIHTAIEPYLYRSIHNECMNNIKQKKVNADYILSVTDKLEVNYENTDKQLIINELEKNIQKAIEKLPPRCKEVFLLSRFNDMSYAEISKSLNITAGTVEIQIVKALRLLRKELSDYLYLLLLLCFFIN